MNWIVITTGLIFLICILVGIYKGAVKIAVSLAATILTFVLVFFLTPYVSEGIASLTPLDEMVESQAVKTIGSMAGVPVGTGGGESQGLTEEKVRKVLEAAGISEAQLNAAGLSVQDIVEGKISGEDLAKYGISSKILDGLNSGEDVEEALEGAEIPRELQIQAIESADIPEFFKSLLLTNNNSEIYKELGAETFVQYLSKYLTKLVLNIAAFILTLIIVTIVLRAIIFALDIVANLPVLGLVNRLAGGVLGAAGGLILVWILFMLVTFLYTTSFGKEAYDAIQGNGLLKVIYDYNPIIQLATTIR